VNRLWVVEVVLLKRDAVAYFGTLRSGELPRRPVLDNKCEVRKILFVMSQALLRRHQGWGVD
jgi:hypothetical protein